MELGIWPGQDGSLPWAATDALAGEPFKLPVASPVPWTAKDKHIHQGGTQPTQHLGLLFSSVFTLGIQHS